MAATIVTAAATKPQELPSPYQPLASLGVGVPIAALSLAVLVSLPPLSAAIAVGSLLLVAFVAHRPFGGALLLTLVYPLQSTYLILHLAAAPADSDLRLYPVDFLVVPLLAGLALNRLRTRRGATRAAPGAAEGEKRWMLWFYCAFFLWAATRVGASASFPRALLGYGHVLAAGGVVVFLALTVDSEKRLLTLLRVFCGTALLLTVVAVLATYYAFLVRTPFYSSPGVQVLGEFALFNMAAGFNQTIVGMVRGFGLTPKHNLSLYLTAALVFSFLLLLRARGGAARVGWAVLIVVFAAGNQQAFSRLSLAGLLLAATAVMLLVPAWRIRIPVALVGLLALYAVGYACSRPFYPSHSAKTETVASGLGDVVSESKYKANSLAGRMFIMGESWTRIQRHPLVGRGPESIGLDPAAIVPHAHNMVLSLWADYGLVGVLLALGALAVAAARVHRVLLRAPRPDDPLWQIGAAVLVAVLCALFEYSFDMPVWSIHLWFMVGLLLATVRQVDARGARQ